MKTASKPSLLSTGRELFQKEGVRGLYRGGLPPFIGGAMFRSAQFGVYVSSVGADPAAVGSGSLFLTLCGSRAGMKWR